MRLLLRSIDTLKVKGHNTEGNVQCTTDKGHDNNAPRIVVEHLHSLARCLAILSHTQRREGVLAQHGRVCAATPQVPSPQRSLEVRALVELVVTSLGQAPPRLFHSEKVQREKMEGCCSLLCLLCGGAKASGRRRTSKMAPLRICRERSRVLLGLGAQAWRGNEAQDSEVTQDANPLLQDMVD